MIHLSEKQIHNIFEKFKEEYDISQEEFADLLRIYQQTKSFKINENIFSDTDNYWDDKLYYLMRLIATEKLKEVFEALKIDLDDPNVNDKDTIETPGRIIKMWAGADTEDDRELLGGRFHKPIRLAKFPNENSIDIPIIKEVDLTAVCSHHLAPFSTKFSEKAGVIIAYIPKDFVLGISKLQRIVRFVAQRGWLQEDLTKAIYNEISKVAETEDADVRLENIKHSYEFLRDALTDSNGFNTEYYGGKFKQKHYLDMVR